jgi:hypothetical protein
MPRLPDARVVELGRIEVSALHLHDRAMQSAVANLRERL